MYLLSNRTDFLRKKIRFIRPKNAKAPVCDIKFLCQVCNGGYPIPISYKSISGKIYLYEVIRPLIDNPVPKNSSVYNIPNDPFEYLWGKNPCGEEH